MRARAVVSLSEWVLSHCIVPCIDFRGLGVGTHTVKDEKHNHDERERGSEIDRERERDRKVEATVVDSMHSTTNRNARGWDRHCMHRLREREKLTASEVPGGERSGVSKAKARGGGNRDRERETERETGR